MTIAELQALARDLGLKAFEMDPTSNIHGLPHWERVLASGLRIAQAMPSVDVWVVSCFAFLHDCRRVNDDRDPQHGPRAESLIRNLHRTGRLRISQESADKLGYAIELHTAGLTSRDPTIGACWDADRLDLKRCGIVPDPRFFSTPEGRRLASMEIKDGPRSDWLDGRGRWAPDHASRVHR